MMASRVMHLNLFGPDTEFLSRKFGSELKRDLFICCRSGVYYHLQKVDMIITMPYMLKNLIEIQWPVVHPSVHFSVYPSVYPSTSIVLLITGL